jgi:hypothetical protein
MGRACLLQRCCAVLGFISLLTFAGRSMLLFLEVMEEVIADRNAMLPLG